MMRRVLNHTWKGDWEGVMGGGECVCRKWNSTKYSKYSSRVRWYGRYHAAFKKNWSNRQYLDWHRRNPEFVTRDTLDSVRCSISVSNDTGFDKAELAVLEKLLNRVVVLVNMSCSGSSSSFSSSSSSSSPSSSSISSSFSLRWAPSFAEMKNFCFTCISWSDVSKTCFCCDHCERSGKERVRVKCLLLVDALAVEKSISSEVFGSTFFCSTDWRYHSLQDKFSNRNPSWMLRLYLVNTAHKLDSWSRLFQGSVLYWWFSDSVVLISSGKWISFNIKLISE